VKRSRGRFGDPINSTLGVVYNLTVTPRAQ
jgi:hypothetical protein